MDRQGVKPKKIMVVDKDDILCLLYKLELEDEGYEVLVASRANQALEIAKTEHLDLIVMDTRIPDMDGIETLKRIADKNPDIPVIINSVFPPSGEKSLSCTAEEYVVKSSDLGELKSKVTIILSGCKQQPLPNSTAWAFR